MEAKVMARTKNPNAPSEEDAQTLQTKVSTELAARARITAMASGQQFGDWLRNLVSEAVEDGGVEITVNGKPFSLGNVNGDAS